MAKGKGKAELSLGSAYFQLIPSLKGSRKKITEDLDEEVKKPVEETSKETGKSAGAELAGGIAAALAAAALGSVLADAWNTGYDSRKALAKVGASLDLTAEQSSRAGQVAGSLYANAYGDNLAEVTTSVGTVISSIEGMSDASEEELEKVSTAAINLGTAFDMDVSQVAVAAGRLIKSGLADTGVEAMDLLTASFQRVPEAMREDIIDATHEYGDFFTSLGIDGQQALGLLVDASAGGVYAIDKTGDALKELTIRSSDMSKTSVEAYEAAGLNAKEMAAKFVAGGDSAKGALSELVAGLKSIKDPVEQSNAAIGLFGTPLEDLGVSQIPTFLDSLENMGSGLGDVAGASENLDAKLNGGLYGIEALQRAFQGVVMNAMEPFMGPANDFAQWAADNPVLIQSVAIAIAALATGLGIAAAAQWVMNSALLASPLTWIIVGIVALAAAIIALIMNWDTVVKWLKSVWDPIMKGIVAVWDWIAKAASTIWGAVASFFVGLWNGIASGASAAWSGLTSWLSGLWSGFVSGVAGIWGAIADFFSGLWSGITGATQTAWNTVLGWIKSLWTSWINAHLSIWNTVLNFFSSLWNGIRTTAQNIWNSLVSWITGIPRRFMDGLSSLGQLGSRAAQWVGGFVSSAKSGFDGIVSWIAGIPQRFLSNLGSMGNLLLSSGKSLIDGFLRGIKGAWNTLTRWVEDGMAHLRGLWPFSPAKWGPFSGRGYVTYSGEAITEDFGKAILRGIPSVDKAVTSLMSTTRNQLNSLDGWGHSVQVDPATSAAPIAPVIHTHNVDPHSTAVAVSQRLRAVL